MKNNLSPVLFIPHGGGPLPLLGKQGHQEMIGFLESIEQRLGNPSAILVISAHWEEDVATITSGESPSLIYDYAGFPDAAYDIKYPVAGNPELANKIYTLLQEGGIKAKLDKTRGFDHGLFVPLKIMYPDAHIPCVQLSLLNSLDAKAHIQIGQALTKLRDENILIVGSGFSFHNMNAFFQNKTDIDSKNIDFEKWLINTCTEKDLSYEERGQRLEMWSDAPFSRYCHPREEHLLPLHICYGIAGSVAEQVFDGHVLGKKTSAFLW